MINKIVVMILFGVTVQALFCAEKEQEGKEEKAFHAQEHDPGDPRKRPEREASAAEGEGGGIKKAKTQHKKPKSVPTSLGETIASYGVEKINDDLYVGKVNEHFYLAMERVDDSNLDMWQEYAYEQCKIIKDTKILDKEGCTTFYVALYDYGSAPEGEIAIDKDLNELWIAYASNIRVTAKAILKDRNPHIEMFVGVLTSPKARITTHLGISRTVEAAQDLQHTPPLRIKQPDQSMHLHSFAAKVMRIKNAKKRVMLTYPAEAMSAIFIRHMPEHSVFIGDNEYRDELTLLNDDSSYVSPLKYLNKLPDESEEQFQQQISERINNLAVYPPRIFVNPGVTSMVVYEPIYGKGGQEILVTFDNTTRTYQWLFASAVTLNATRVLIDLEALARVKSLMPMTAVVPLPPAATSSSSSSSSSSSEGDKKSSSLSSLPPAP